MNFLPGYKTYLVCFVTIVWAVYGLISGHTDANVSYQSILGALAVSGLRHSIQ